MPPTRPVPDTARAVSASRQARSRTVPAAPSTREVPTAQARSASAWGVGATSGAATASATSRSQCTG